MSYLSEYFVLGKEMFDHHLSSEDIFSQSVVTTRFLTQKLYAAEGSVENKIIYQHDKLLAFFDMLNPEDYSLWWTITTIDSEHAPEDCRILADTFKDQEVLKPFYIAFLTASFRNEEDKAAFILRWK